MTARSAERSFIWSNDWVSPNTRIAGSQRTTSWIHRLWRTTKKSPQTSLLAERKVNPVFSFFLQRFCFGDPVALRATLRSRSGMATEGLRVCYSSSRFFAYRVFEV